MMRDRRSCEPCETIRCIMDAIMHWMLPWRSVVAAGSTEYTGAGLEDCPVKCNGTLPQNARGENATGYGIQGRELCSTVS